MKRSKFVAGGKVDVPLLDPLFQDVARCDEMLEKDDTPFTRRALVRATFAFIEAELFWLQGVMRNRMVAMTGVIGSINIDKLAALSETRFQPDDQGVMRERDNRMGLKSRMGFTIRTFAELAFLDPTEFFKSEPWKSGWNAFEGSIKVRDRITHPKEVEHLTITDEELETLSSAVLWVYNTIAEILNRSSPSDPDAGPTAP